MKFNNSQTRKLNEKYITTISAHEIETIILNIYHSFRISNLLPDEFFNQLPYSGVLYIPISCHDWWIDIVIGVDICAYKMIKAKVIECDDQFITYVYYDNHNHHFTTLTRYHKGYMVKGNILIKET